MTKSPVTIDCAQTVHDAQVLMQKHGIRDLPVLKDGKLLGIVSARDLKFIETLKSLDIEHANVTDAMSVETYVVNARTPIYDVVEEMTQRKYGAVVIVDRGKVVGIFTTEDALKVLFLLLWAEPLRPSAGAISTAVMK